MAPKYATAKIMCQRPGGCTGFCPQRVIEKLAASGEVAKCRVCDRGYRIPPGAKTKPTPVAKDTKALQQQQAALARENAKLKEENKQLRSKTDVVAGDVPDNTDIDRLSREIGSLKVMDGAETLLAAKQAELQALRNKRFSSKPSHVQLRDLDTRIEKKTNQLEKARSSTIPELVGKLQEAHRQMASWDHELGELQEQRKSLLEATPDASAPAATLDSLGKMQGLLELVKAQVAMDEGLQTNVVAMEKMLVGLQAQCAQANSNAEGMPEAKPDIPAPATPATPASAANIPTPQEDADMWAEFDKAMQYSKEGAVIDDGYTTAKRGEEYILDWASKFRDTKRLKGQQSG